MWDLVRSEWLITIFWFDCWTVYKAWLELFFFIASEEVVDALKPSYADISYLLKWYNVTFKCLFVSLSEPWIFNSLPNILIPPHWRQIYTLALENFNHISLVIFCSWYSKFQINLQTSAQNTKSNKNVSIYLLRQTFL